MDNDNIGHRGQRGGSATTHNPTTMDLGAETVYGTHDDNNMVMSEKVFYQFFKYIAN